MSRSAKAHILLVLVTLIWGATFVQIKAALVYASPLLFNVVRMSLAAVVLLLIYRKDVARLTPQAFRAGAIVGFFLWLGYEFQTTGLTYKLTTPSKSAFLTGVSVVLVPVFLAVFFRRHINRWTMVGVIAAFIGLYLLTVPAGQAGGADFSSISQGDLLTIGCAISFAFQIIFMGRATHRYPFQQIATIEASVCAVLMAISVPVLEKPYAVWNSTVVAAILVTGLLGTAAAFTVQAWAQQFTPPTHTALIFSLEPVFAWITSFILLRERLGARGGVGATLILGGVLLSELKGSTQAATDEEIGSGEEAAIPGESAPGDEPERLNVTREGGSLPKKQL
jgi:drug/metabolite transporter (DMT)-like permease